MNYFSKCPPSKRPNYFIYGITSPFRPLWSNIVRDWALQYDPTITVINPYRFYALRDRRLLSGKPLLPSNVQTTSIHSLVPIRVSIKGKKGVIDNSTLIYLPTTDDLKNNKRAIVESRHCDRARTEERKMKKAQQSYKKGKTMIKLIEQRVNNTEQAIIHDCDRQLLGAVTSGAFQFSRACCTGKGFIAMGGLLTLLQQQEGQKMMKKHVLIRMTTSQYYHWALLEL